METAVTWPPHALAETPEAGAELGVACHRLWGLGVDPELSSSA